jgi:hypothetical protein
MKALFVVRGEKMIPSTKMFSSPVSPLKILDFRLPPNKNFELLKESLSSLLATILLFFYHASDENIRVTYEIKTHSEIVAAGIKHYNSPVFLLRFFIDSKYW